MSGFLKQALAGLRILLVMTVVLGFVYPLAVFGVGRLIPDRADGSLINVDGRRRRVQPDRAAFDGDQWFQPRPSAAGDGYDTLASGASNLGPENEDLLAAVEERRERGRRARRASTPTRCPVDAVTASGSGLDPHISPEYAQLQVARVARERGLSEDEVRELVAEATTGRSWASSASRG